MPTISPGIREETIEIEQVVDAHGRRTLVSFPFERYRGAYVALFLARRGGAVVGTISVAVDEQHAAFHGERAATFGFFECVNDQAVAARLLAAAEGHARTQGATLIRGPMSFSTNHELGLLVEGFHTPPMVMMTHNPPSYAALIEGCGYSKAMDLFAYVGDLDDRLQHMDRGIIRVAERAARQTDVRVRRANIRDFNGEVRRIKAIYRQAWADNWGFVPITDDEADHLAASLRPIIDPDLVLIAETPDGTPVGMAIALPDLHQALLHSGGGPMFPFGLIKFLWQRRRIDQLRLWGMGMSEAYRGRGIDAIFYVELARIARAKGYRRFECSWVLETNTMMIRIIEHGGLTRYKTYRVYEKPL
jgi:GNAT superfamily N-acetyltransferase